MSKKNKHKFKKQLKAQILQQMTQAQNASEPPAAPTNIQPTANETVSAAPVIPAISAQSVELQNLAQIKYDLKKTALVIAGMAIAIGILFFINQKNGLLLNFGHQIFRVFNIQ